MSKTLDEAFENLCRERGEIVDEHSRNHIHYQRRLVAFKEGVAWKEERDAEIVGAVKVKWRNYHQAEGACDEVLRRIKEAQ